MLITPKVVFHTDPELEARRSHYIHTNLLANTYAHTETRTDGYTHMITKICTHTPTGTTSIVWS